MRINSRHLALITVGACAIAPANALAQSQLDAVTHNSSAVAPCTRDYSLNSVSGGYCASDANSAAPITNPSLPTVIVKHDDGGFSWSDAGAGAGFTIALIAVATGGAIAFRRRSPSVGSHSSAATR
jgi:hypothetical protein